MYSQFHILKQEKGRANLGLSSLKSSTEHFSSDEDSLCQKCPVSDFKLILGIWVKR